MKNRAALKYLSLFLAFLVSALCMPSCSAQAFEVRSVYALSTVIELKIEKDENSSSILAECESLIHKFEAEFSAHKEGSSVYELNKNSGGVQKISPELSALLNDAYRLSDLTDGAYDFTVGALTRLWAITDSFAPIPDDREILDAMELIGYKKASIAADSFLCPDGMKIDLGGIAKGRLAELIMEHLASYGVDYAVISIGGNIAVMGENPGKKTFNIGIKDPAGGTFGALTLAPGESAEYVSVSGGYERYKQVDGIVYHHIIDPSTGRPASSELLSVAVISNSGVEADALSTAFYVMGYESAIEFYGRDDIDFEAIFIFEDGRIATTDGCRFTPT